ncbi:helix-turn-helix domain-containing protein [uncultured Robinsoniella sp.]|uniref:helix-turn-helix domain-containing protein n=1 Tax=uncultured Robinsoniella sp. TaxID=904190 RepID=UPI00374FD3C6
MFSENLKTARAIKGLTQAELAIRLNVVRQTISKWEKGLSVPDADMLIRISELFEIPVSELLGSNIQKESDKNDIAEQLSRINEQLAIKNRRSKLIQKIVLGIIIGFVVINILLVIVGAISLSLVGGEGKVTVTNISDQIMQDE